MGSRSCLRRQAPATRRRLGSHNCRNEGVLLSGYLCTVCVDTNVTWPRPDHVRVQPLRSAQAEPIGPFWRIDTQPHGVAVEPDAPPGERGRTLPEETNITARSAPRARDNRARERGGTLMTENIQFIVSNAGMQVRGKRRTVGGEVWEQRLRIQWSAVTAIGFATGRHDPVVALYAWAAVGRPRHVADSRFLNDLQWAELGKLIAEATRGRLTLDAASRHNPRSIRPDW